MARLVVDRQMTPTTDDLLAAVHPEASRRLLQSALDRFAARGYHATTTREISVGAAMSPAALYVHYRSKEELLFQMSRIAHEASLSTVRAAAAAGDAAAAAGDIDAAAGSRIRAIVYAFTAWHGRHLALARVAQYELGALSAEHYAEVAKVRRQTERIFRTEVEQGVRSGQFSVPNVQGATLAIMALGIDVVRWFQPGGRRTPESLAETYAELALKMLCANGA